MKQNKYLSTLKLVGLSLFLFTLTIAQQEYQYYSEFGNYPYAGTQCYPDGCVDYSSWASGVSRSFSSAYDYMNQIATQLDMGVGNRGYKKDEQGRYVGLSCYNSLIAKLNPTNPTCSNSRSNPPACDICGPGTTLTEDKCLCNNLANNAPSCNICPSGLLMQNNLCVCANGALNPSACNTCPAGANMINGQCKCQNNGDLFTQCNSCRSGQAMDNTGVCRDTCTTTNVCGQTINGFMNSGKCDISQVQNPNESCIVNFNVTTNTVNPNGSVEFSWSLANLPSGIGAKCGFVDLTTPTPRPIPGLQNLDTTIDKVRINNVQATTRFCLVCQYYNLLQSNTLLGEAVKHQWVRVLRVGEN